jgi:hypothetical protein
LNSNILPAYEKVRGVFGNNPGALLVAEMGGETDLKNGNMLFKTTTFHHGVEMKESVVNYGVLPIPMRNEMQKQYYSLVSNYHDSMFAVINTNVNNKIKA